MANPTDPPGEGRSLNTGPGAAATAVNATTVAEDGWQELVLFTPGE